MTRPVSGSRGDWRRPLLLVSPLLLLLLLPLLLHPPTVDAAATGGAVSEVGSCWRLKRRDGSCGRLLRSGVTRSACCSDRHRRGWSVTAPYRTVVIDTASHSANNAPLKPFNATSQVVTLDVARRPDTCSPCASSCAGVVCGEDRKCVVRCGAPRCVCSPQCHLKHKKPVCGSDGRTYKSECHLLKRACRKKKRLLVHHYGPCQTCSGVRCSGGKKCVLDEQMTPRCVRCPASCPQPPPDTVSPRPLCAADTRTYLSPCHLKRASCRAAYEIPRAYKGPCRAEATCNSVRCWKAQRCLTHESTGQPQCTSCGTLDSCSRPSSSSSRPVCATDGRVYTSWCAFRHEACRSGRAMALTLHHHCAQNHTEVDDCNKQQYKPKRKKQRRRQEVLRASQNALRQQLQEVAEATGSSTYHKFDLEASINSVEAGLVMVGGTGGGPGTGGRVKATHTHNTENRKNRKRKRRRRNCKKNRDRARRERERNKAEEDAAVEAIAAAIMVED